MTDMRASNRGEHGETTLSGRRRPSAVMASIPTLCVLVAFTAAGCALPADSALGLIVEGGGTASDDVVPEVAYCDAVADWDAVWVNFENVVLELVNRQRAAGADCGSTGTFTPANPLSMSPALRCAARNHSLDMSTRDYFDHYSPEGEGPGERLDRSGYHGSTWGENIAWGYATPEAVVSGWMSSPGHCANIMGGQFTETGIGYHEGSLWTQTFGRP